MAAFGMSNRMLDVRFRIRSAIHDLLDHYPRADRFVDDLLVKVATMTPPGLLDNASKHVYERLHGEIMETIHRQNSGSLLPTDMIAPQSVRFDGLPTAVEGLLRNREVHEPDFHIFGWLKRSQGTVLDVGANWGYSVGSMRAAGCDCPILSFEVLHGYAGCLGRMKELLGRDYDYVMCGVGDAPATLTFRTPVVSRLAITALTSARLNTFSECYAAQVVEYVKTYMRNVAPPYRFQFLVQEVEVDTLDHLLSTRKVDVPLDRIAAIKIDVEGLESAVLQGARSTCERDKPLLMTESAGLRDAVHVVTESMGYRPAEFVAEERRLRPCASYTTHTNEFFYHPDNESRYRAIGLLAD